jgi:protein-tyrosine phosphatase
MDEDLAERLLALEGGINFRDMGGYATAEGRRVKWRTLYRSGTMARLTPGDYESLAERGIRTVIDLRTTVEQQKEPNAWCAHAGITYWCRDHDETFGHLHDMVDKGIASAAEAEAVMQNGFRMLPFQQAEAYAELFRRIAAGDIPIVFNCTAGKDRTGGGAALVLAALGVPRETIAADFSLTERAVDLRKAFRAQPSPSADRYMRLGEDVMQALGGARPSYIAALLDSVEERCGSIEGYLADLGFTPGDVRAVREALLD